MLNISPKITNKNAKIIFIDSKSYNKFYKNQPEIKKLKYNCGNNNITHYIQYDDFVFRLSTHYKHQPKSNEISEHINEIVYSAQYAKEHIGEIIEKQTQKLKNWKHNIDIMPYEILINNENIKLAKKKTTISTNIINKIKNFFFK